MQITQFILGASYTMLHSFITYVAPVTVTRGENGAQASPQAAADPAVQTAGGLDSLKQLVFGSAAQAGSNAPASTGAVTETIYTEQPCIVSTGETYAIWMNVLYLAPLTYLFVSFFITSYLKRSSAASKLPSKASRRLSNNVTLAEKAGWDAARGVEREVYGGENMASDDSAVADEDAPTPKRGKGKGKARRRG